MYRGASPRLITLALIASACTRQAPPPLEHRQPPSAGALFINGDFANGLSAWTVTPNLNDGITYPPAKLADLWLQGGGSPLTVVRSGGAGSQIPKGLDSSTSLRFPRAAAQSAVINELGKNHNVNTLAQQYVTTPADVDPFDGLVHVRFALAPILQHPTLANSGTTHNEDEQPYYWVQVTNLSQGGKVLTQAFHYADEPGVPWQIFSPPNPTQNDVDVAYTAWQAFDVSPGSAALQVGDQIELRVVSAGCSLGGHWGEVLLESVGSFLPGLSVVASAPSTADDDTNLTYTYRVNNNGPGPAGDVVVTQPLPTNTAWVGAPTLVGNNPPGSTIDCTPPTSANGNVASCRLGLVNAGASVSFQLTFHIALGATGSIDDGNYSVAASNEASLIGPLVSTQLTHGKGLASLSLTMSDGVSAVVNGQSLAYTITLGNAGPASPPSVQLVDTIPAQLSGIGWTCKASGGASCCTSKACDTASGSGKLSQSPQLPVGGQLVYVLSGQVSTGGASLPLSFTNSATVTPSSGYSDPDPNDDSAAVTNTVVAPSSIDTLNVTKLGSGQGAVVSSPAGLSCGPGCTSQSGRFADHGQVTLFAIAPPGSLFAGWGGASGACSGQSPQCTFTITGSNTDVTASFVKAWAITSTSSGSGTVVCPVQVIDGQSATCTVTAASGWALTGLTDTAGGSTSNVALPLPGGQYLIAQVTSAHAIAATFTPTFPVTTSVASASGTGTLSCTPSQVPMGQAAVCTVAPAAGWTLGDLTDSVFLNGVFQPPVHLALPLPGNQYVLTSVTAPHALVATFVKLYQVTPHIQSPSGSGTAACDSPVAVGSPSTCRFTPTQSAAQSWVVTQVIDETLDAGGQVTGQVDVTAQALSGHYTIPAVTADHAIVVTFTQTFTVTASISGGGAISCAAPGGAAGVPILSGQPATCTVTPAQGSVLVSLVDQAGGSSTDVTAQGQGGQYTIPSVTGNHVLVAVFVQDVAITTTVTSGSSSGTLACSPMLVELGQATVCTAAPASGWQLTQLTDSVWLNGAWQAPAEVGLPLSNNQYVIAKVTAPHALLATFKKLYRVTPSIPSGSASGTVACTSPVVSGSASTCTVSPTQTSSQSWVVTKAIDQTLDQGGAVVAQSDVTAQAKSGSYTIAAVTADHALQVTFTQTFTITASISGGGSIGCTSPGSPAGAPILSGQPATCTITPAQGSVLTSLSDQTKSGSTNVLTQGQTGQYTIASVSENHVLVAVFTQSIAITTTVSSGSASGTLSCSPSPVLIGHAAVCTASPGSAADPAWTLTSLTDSVSQNGAWQTPVAVPLPLANNQYTIAQVNAPHALVATFKKLYRVTATIASGGAAGSFSCDSPVVAGGTSRCSFTQSPQGGLTWLLTSAVDQTLDQAGNVTSQADVTAQAAGGSYQITGIAADHHLILGYTQTFTITTSISGSGTISCTSPGYSNGAPVLAGRSSTCTITPAQGNVLTGLFDQSAGSSSNVLAQGQAGSYTIAAIAANHLLVATFRFGPGHGCAAASDCGSNFCVDGFCCNSSCDDQCEACDVRGSEGTCSPVVGAPHQQRPACTSDAQAPGCAGACDGRNVLTCRYPAAETACRSGSCDPAAGVATLPAACDGAGHCPAAQLQACDPYVCGPTACLGDCKSDRDCKSGDWCSASVCVPKLDNGKACGQSDQCKSDSCVDGYCCNSTCDGQCQACNVAGSLGTCSPVTGAPHGARPACVADPSSPMCAGSCDGSHVNACGYPGSDVSCRSASCSENVAVAAAVCDGTGHCPAPVTQACDPYVCGDTACKGNCASDDDCQQGDFCSLGICTKKSDNGQGCGASDQCTSGFCVDGLCCDRACDGQCEACDATGSAGTCRPIAGPPHGARSSCASDGTSCGGSCGGVDASACTYPGTDQGCRDASCSGGVAVLAATCDGVGHCPAPKTQSCDPFVCGATACLGDCQDDTQCKAGDFCSGGLCKPKETGGGTCNQNDQCQSGFCVDGVCCDRACDGQCEACDVAGSTGTCTPVSGNPHGPRTACSSDGSVCGGSCDGTSGQQCAYPDSSVSCRDASCTGGVATPAASCDGAGSCPTPIGTNCNPYLCGPTACATSCGGDSDCAPDYVCSNRTCLPRGTGAWRVQGSGGCQSSGGETLWPLLLAALGVGLLRMRRRRAALLVGLCLAAPVARAQSAPPITQQFVADRFQPGAGTFDILGVGSAETAPHLETHLSLFLSYAREPLRLVSVSSGSNQFQLLSSQTLLHLGASVGLFGRFEVGLVMPLALAQGSDPNSALGVPLSASAGLGDLRVVPKVKLLDTEEFAVGLALPFTLPTGKDQSYLSAGTPTLGPEVRGESKGYRLRVAASAGLLLREQRQFSNLQVSNAFTYGLGAELPFRLGEQQLAAMATAAGELNLSQDQGVERPLEVMGALRWFLPADLSLTLGGGPGVTNGYGTPRYRIFAGVGLDPRRMVQSPGVPRPVEPPLTARDASARTAQGKPVDVPIVIEGSGQAPFTVAPRQPPTSGEATQGEGLVLHYQPRPDFTGSETFPIEVRDARGRSARANVSVQVDAPPPPPPPPPPEPVVQPPDLPLPALTVAKEETLPVPPPELKGNKLIVFAPIQFDHDKDTLLPSALPVLDGVVQVLTENPEIELLRIEGHTDGHGTRKHNRDLSQRRAESVRRYLVAHGIAAARLTAKGFGPDRPITTNVTAAGRAQNRRVEFLVMKRKPAA